MFFYKENKMNDDKNSLPKTLKEYMEQRLTLKAIDPSELDNTANYYDKILALRLVILGQNFSEHFKFYIQDKITDKIISKIILDYYEKQGYKIREIMSLFFSGQKNRELISIIASIFGKELIISVTEEKL